MKWLVAVLVVAGCKSPPSEAHHAPVEVKGAHPEGAMPEVRLSAEAIRRLGIEITAVEAGSVPRARLVGGEVVVPPGRTVTVTAPVAGLVRVVAADGLAPGSTVKRGAPLLQLTALAPADRDTHARVAREVAAAEANLAALELRVSRNQALVNEKAGSARALEEATAARDVAKADAETARSRAQTLSRDPLLSDVVLVVRSPADGVVRQRTVAEGQSVPAGAPMLELVGVDALQVRVPVYGGDLARLDASASARVRRVGQGPGVEATPIAGPPTAEVERSTVDRFYLLPSDAALSPGERVLVELPLRESSSAVTVPAASVVLDAWGGTWVYRCNDGRYERARVDPSHRVGDRLVLARGPAAGSCVVSVGAAELFGAEFPPGH